MKLLVAGSEGSIGKRRSLILSEMGHEVKGVDIKNQQYLTAKKAKEYDAVFLCVPPQQLTLCAAECLSAETPFFLEKPGAVSYRDLLSLHSQLEKTDLINMVACNLRFTSEYKAIQDSLPNLGKPLLAYAEFGYFLPWWREGQYRTYYSCYKMAGGGILMDAIHEVDYMFSLFGYPLAPLSFTATYENTKELAELDAEDTATIHLVYKTGMTMLIHLDYLQRAYKRVFFAIGTKGRIDQTFNVQAANSMYRDEMAHFLHCVKTGTKTLKPVSQHLQVLEFVDKIRNSKMPEGIG